MLNQTNGRTSCERVKWHLSKVNEIVRALGGFTGTYVIEGRALSWKIYYI
jgi:hypothetical protein